MKTIKKILRIFSTGASFALFMLLGLSFGTIILPIIKLVIRNKKKRVRLIMRGVKFLWAFHIKFMITFKAFEDVRFSGLDKFKQNSPCILLSNHPTLIDVVAIGSKVQNLSCVVKESLWKHPFFGGIIRNVNFVPNTKATKMLKLCKQVFDEHRPLLIFPEGTRTTDALPNKFKRGAAQIALRLNIPVIPVVITCTPPTLAKNIPWYIVPYKAPVLTVCFKDPLTIPQRVIVETTTAAKARVLTQYWETYWNDQLNKNQQS